MTDTTNTSATNSPTSTIAASATSATAASARTTVLLAVVTLWSAAMIVVGVLWATGILDAPFAKPGGGYPTMLDDLPRSVGALLVAASSLLSFIVSAALLTVRDWRARARTLVGLVTVGLTALTVTVYTGTLLLAYLGYALSLQFPPLPAEVLWQALMVAGPVLWIGVWASLGAKKGDRTASRASAGSNGPNAASTGGAARVIVAARVTLDARIAVGVAMVIPFGYGLTRILWALGVPFGLTTELFERGNSTGLWHTGLALAIAGIVGALLTLGLVQSWGERLPRWCGPLAGRRVPITLATVPAGIVSLAIITGGIGMERIFLGPNPPEVFAGSWGAITPVLLFPLWGIALAWATVRYRARRLAGEQERSSSTF